MKRYSQARLPHRERKTWMHQHGHSTAGHAQRHFYTYLQGVLLLYVQGGRRREHKLASIYTNKQEIGNIHPSGWGKRAGHKENPPPQGALWAGQAGDGDTGRTSWDLRFGGGPTAAPHKGRGCIPAPKGGMGWGVSRENSVPRGKGGFGAIKSRTGEVSTSPGLKIN